MTDSADTRYYDTLEAQPSASREADLFARLPEFLAQAVSVSKGLAEHLATSDVSAITDRASLATLPVLRKSALMAAQAADPPFGGFADPSALDGTRIFCSPGPVWEPQAPGTDPWQCARALYAAGIRAGDRVHNAFSYHMTPGAHILDEGARALGCQVFPAGVGNTDAQVEAAAVYRPDVYVGTPDYLKILLDAAQQKSLDLSSIKRALVSGGALFPALRAEYSQRHVQVLQCYATADLGVIAYESEFENQVTPGMIVNEHLIVEIVRPGTDTPVAAGEVGELVVTNFNSAYPLVRFATGDLSAVLPGDSPCGRTGIRIRGWMGRADQRTKVKGMFVDPQQVAKIHQTHPEIDRMRLVVGRENNADTLTLMVQAENPDTAALAATLKSVTGLSGQVAVASGALPNDGLVVADEREYSHD